jgi:hypothetical protein
MKPLYQVTAEKLQPFFCACMPVKALRNAFLFCLAILLSNGLMAQDKPKTDAPPPLPTREVSGIVKDSTDLGVIGATVTLTSAKDTVKTSTNSDGIFIFKNIKSATYTIVVQSIGYTSTPPMRFKQNDLTPRIVMDPIFLKEQKNTLNEVVINGTPSITYKTDTVEYKASDYVVRKNATVDELLKKMEGMEVGADGTLVHNGESVVKAKVNGKDFLGGDIANAIKNLPAEIVDKIQIVDDYGDQAARTGVKDGDPSKILNITTRTDKSVGNMLRLNSSAGNKDRLEAGLFGTRINGNQQIGVRGNFQNTVNGIAGSEGGAGGNGTTKAGSGSVSIRDKIGKKVEYNFNYGFNARGTNSLNESESLLYSTTPDGTFPTHSLSASQGDNNTSSHDLKLEVEAELDSNNFLRFIPTFRYNSSTNIRSSTSFQTGLRHQDRVSSSNSDNTTPEFGASIFYQHTFKGNRRRNLSLQADANSSDNEAEQAQLQSNIYFGDADEIIDQNEFNRIVARRNQRSNYRGSLTYVEPLGINTQLEFNGQVNYNGYDNNATTRNVMPAGLSEVIDSLSNIYKYSFTQGRLALNFRYGMSSTSRIRFSAGVTGVPAVLSGTKLSLGTTINRHSFNLVPIARVEYLWSRQHRISMNYSGNANEPTFDQIQPVRDVTNQQNPVIGNPNLLASFTHTIRADYSNYIANSKLNFNVNLNANFFDSSVIRSNTEILDPDVEQKPNQPIYITETRFVNMNGAYRLGGNYNISKQLDNRKYNLAFRGGVNYDHRLSLNKQILNVNTLKSFYERFGPRITPNDWLEVAPSISYNVTTSSNSNPLFIGYTTRTTALNIEGRFYLWETNIFGYDASKSFVSGIGQNVTKNPFVINFYVEKELFERRGKITLQAYDILNQNNFLIQDQPVNGGFINTKTNPNSRYFMLRLSMNLQKWSGAQGRGGRGVMRRGDGSFMN